jgi:glycosyltransferase involved in cell wall biosynthesis
MTPRTKSRIALLFEYSTLNGGERSMLACLDWWRHQAAGMEFVAIAPARGRLAEELLSRSLEVIPWTRDDGDPALIQIIQQAHPDLLHANSLSMGRVTGRIAAKVSIPTSSHLRDIVHLSSAAMADLNRNRLLIAVSFATRDAHAARGMDADRVVVVHNGVDLVKYQPRPRRGWLRQELMLPGTAVLAATIGQIGLRKGQDVLAAAAPLIVQRAPNVHFLLIGERSSTKAESVEFELNIDRQFASNHLSAQFHRLGYRDDIPDLMPEIDLIIHPASQEPFGRVLLEATACGVPVVATSVGGTAEIVVDNVTGRLVPPRDPQLLANAVADLIADSETRHCMSVAARSRAEQEFHVGRCAEQLLECWSRL